MIWIYIDSPRRTDNVQFSIRHSANDASLTLFRSVKTTYTPLLYIILDINNFEVTNSCAKSLHRWALFPLMPVSIEFYPNGQLGGYPLSSEYANEPSGYT